MRNTKQAGTSTGKAIDLRTILQDIALAGIRCRELARLGKSGEAEQALATARELYAELLATADLENPVHHSIARNRRYDLSAMEAEVESCRLKQETKKLCPVRKKALV